MIAYFVFALNVASLTFAIAVAVHDRGPTAGTFVSVLLNLIGFSATWPSVRRRLRGK